MWQTIAPKDMHDSILNIVLEVAQRLRDPEYVAASAGEVAGQMPESTRHFALRWTPFDLAFGDAGLAVFYGQMDLCFPDNNWDSIAHAYLIRAAHSLETYSLSGLSPALYGGIAGTGLAAHLLSRGGRRYQRLLKEIDLLVSEKVLNLSLQFRNSAQRHRVSDYDLISGMAGSAAYLLLRPQGPANHQALDAILDFLVNLSQTDNDSLGYFLAPGYLPGEERAKIFPNGCTILGLAHGVPGPLGVLALAYMTGFDRSDVRSAIEELTQWIIHQVSRDDWGNIWPDGIPPVSVGPKPTATSLPSWCYGSPGIAQALWLAGSALGDSSVITFAIDTMVSVAKRPRALRNLFTPILCHGEAGLLQCIDRFANKANSHELGSFAIELTEDLMAKFDSSFRFGFRNAIGNYLMDDPGFLNGACGIALSLLAATQSVEPDWDRALLLS
jgi:lantibiotic biosynthesis protein